MPNAFFSGSGGGTSSCNALLPCILIILAVPGAAIAGTGSGPGIGTPGSVFSSKDWRSIVHDVVAVRRDDDRVGTAGDDEGVGVDRLGVDGRLSHASFSDTRDFQLHRGRAAAASAASSSAGFRCVPRAGLGPTSAMGAAPRLKLVASKKPPSASSRLGVENCATRFELCMLSE